MSWGETFTHWQMWAAAVFLASILYAILKLKVSVGGGALRSVALGAALAKKTGDTDFARAGVVMARNAWRKRKLSLLAISAVAGALIFSVLFALVPALVGFPGWLYGVAAGIGVVVFFVSKY